MKTVILADRLGKELLPLTDGTSTALLPVVGKAVIEHTMDQLAGAGIKQAVVVLAAQADQVRELLGDGRRWGLSLEFALSRGEESAAAILDKIPGGRADCYLLIRGDMLRGGNLADFLTQAETITGPVVHGLLSGRYAGLSLYRNAEVDLAPLNWPTLAKDSAGSPEAGLNYGEAGVYPLDSLADFHRANLDAAAGDIEGLRIPGRETGLGLIQGRNTRMSPGSLKVGAAWIGSGCRIDPSAELRGVVAIADHVIIDRMARLTNTVVLPNTYVGELVDLREAIVRGNDLIRVDSGACLHISDAFLLADLKQTTLGGTFAAPLHRLAGLALLLLSLPLWPLAVLAARRENPGQLFIKRRLRGNRIGLSEFGQRQRMEFTALEFATRIPILRALPLILAVMNGDLRVVGVEAVTMEQAENRLTEWERLADNAPAGLLGPTQLRLGPEVPEEERLMSDAFYAAHRSAGANCFCLWEGVTTLFSRRAWYGGSRPC